MASASDRNLIVGLLAFQLDLVSKDELVAAMGKWAAEKSKTLEDVFLDAQVIDRQTHQLLGSLVAKRLALTDQDSKPLLKPSADVESVRNELSQLADADINQSLSSMLPGTSAITRNANSEETAKKRDAVAWETLEPVTNATTEERRYRVLRPHASGGLGEVSIALDSELNRQVALKQMHARFADDSDARQRFLVEAEITGNLEHPGVVPVYGLGSYADGRPFYAMRFIRGESLREASDRYHQKFDRTRRTTEQILELRRLLSAFRDVCQTMEYAHRSGVLHRDLKPDNIMLGSFGETLVVDWGLAKPASGDVLVDAAGGNMVSPHGSRSSVTATTMGSVVGTPAFMSPEQAQGRVDQISVASDVYSLGATLYYLICGQSPFGSNSNDNGSSVEVGKVLQRVARGEFLKPRYVDPSIPKPLAAICTKAMALPAHERYESAAQMGDDLERFLADEPILAFVDPPVVRMKRWVRRHQTLTITAASLIVACTLGLSVFSSLLAAKQTELELTNQNLVAAERQANESARLADQRRAEAENRRAEADAARQQAETARQQAEQSQAAELAAKADALAFSDFLVNNILAAARPKDVYGGQGIEITVVDAIRIAEVDLARVFEGRPRAEAIARLGIGDTWYNLGEYQRATEQLAQAADLFTQTLGGDHINTLTARSAYALATAHLGDFDKAIGLQRELAEKLEVRLGSDAQETLTELSNLALSLSEVGDYEQAILLLQDVFERSLKSFGERSPATLRSKNNYADGLRFAANDRRQEAIELLQETIEADREVFGVSHPDTLKAVNNLATLLQEVGDSAQAISLLRKTLEHMSQQLGADHPTTLVTKTNLAFAYSQAGQYAAAIELLMAVVEQSSSKLSADHPNTLNAMDILASTYAEAGETAQAIELFQHVVEGRERVLGLANPDTLTSKNNWAMAYLSAGQAKTSVSLFESVLAERRKSLSPSDPNLMLSIENLADAYEAVGQIEKALPLFRELRDTLSVAADRETGVRISNNLANAYLRTNQPQLAVTVLEKLLVDLKHSPESVTADLETIYHGLAIGKFRTGQFLEATELFRSAIERQRKRYAESKLEIDQSLIRGLLIYLANCQIRLGDYRAAEASARESAEIARELLPDDWRLFNAESIWGEALLKQGRLDEAAPLIEASHEQLLSRQDLLPRDLQLEFLVPSFDRVIELYQARQDSAAALAWESRKQEFMNAPSP